MKLSTELCFVCNTPLFFSNRQLLQHHLQTNHQHVFQIETKTDRLTVGDIVSFPGIPCGLVQLNFAFPLLKQVQQQQQQEQEEIEKEKDGCSSSSSSSKSGSNRASLVRGHRICQKMDCATKWINPDGNLLFEWIVLFDNCCKRDMSVLNIWPKDETNRALLRNDQPTMICALHLPQHIRSQLFRTGLLPPVPTSKAAQDAYWQYSKNKNKRDTVTQRLFKGFNIFQLFEKPMERAHQSSSSSSSSNSSSNNIDDCNTSVSFNLIGPCIVKQNTFKIKVLSVDPMVIKKKNGTLFCKNNYKDQRNKSTIAKAKLLFDDTQQQQQQQQQQAKENKCKFTNADSDSDSDLPVILHQYNSKEEKEKEEEQIKQKNKISVPSFDSSSFSSSSVPSSSIFKSFETAAETNTFSNNISDFDFEDDLLTPSSSSYCNNSSKNSNNTKQLSSFSSHPKTETREENYFPGAPLFTAERQAMLEQHLWDSNAATNVGPVGTLDFSIHLPLNWTLQDKSKSSILSIDSLSKKHVDIKDLEKSVFPVDRLVLSLVAVNKDGSQQKDIFLQQIEVAAPPSSQSSPSDSPLPDYMFLDCLAAEAEAAAAAAAAEKEKEKEEEEKVKSVKQKSKQQPLRLPNSTTTTNESEFSCKFCPITFTLEKEFNAHNTALHLQEIFFTAVAEAEKSKTAAAAAAVSKSVSDYSYDYDSVSEEEEEEEKTKYSKRQLPQQHHHQQKQQQQQQSTLKPASCAPFICLYKPASKADLQMHVLSNHLECPFKNCNYRAKVPGELQSHARSVHPQVKKKNNKKITHSDSDSKTATKITSIIARGEKRPPPTPFPDTDSAFLLPSSKPFSVPEATAAAAAAAKKQTPIQHPSMLKQQQHN